jgi:hypothetical protein
MYGCTFANGASLTFMPARLSTVSRRRSITAGGIA